MSDERLKLLFGFVLVALLIVLAAIIAVGNVRQETSFGLRDIHSANWASIGILGAINFRYCKGDS